MRILHTADWHLGHPHTDASTVIKSLRKFLIPRLPEVDLLVVAGDVYDNTLSFSTDATRAVIEFLNELLSHVVALELDCIFLKGTTLHDRDQVKTIGTLAKERNAEQYVRIVEKPSILNIQKRSFLCLPDDLPFENKADLFEFIGQLLLQQPDGMVDYCALHGMFDFACQGADHTDSYRVEDFIKIVRRRVMCGHVHRDMASGFVQYAGSTDRFAHNEEHPKGFYIHDDKSSSFVENTDAVRYLTFEYNEPELETLCNTHSKNMEKLFSGVDYGYCRVILHQPDLRQSLRQFHSSKYPNIRFKYKRSKNKQKIEEKIELEHVELEVPTIGNLGKIITKHIGEDNVTIGDVQAVLDSL